MKWHLSSRPRASKGRMRRALIAVLVSGASSLSMAGEPKADEFIRVKASAPAAYSALLAVIAENESYDVQKMDATGFAVLFRNRSVIKGDSKLACSVAKVGEEESQITCLSQRVGIAIGKSGEVRRRVFARVMVALASVPPVAPAPAGNGSGSPTAEESGVFRIESTPPGADIYVDGEFVGTTPVVEHRMRSGKHEIELRRKGFSSWSRQLNVSAGARGTVAAELEP
jgi:hypothetical protein